MPEIDKMEAALSRALTYEELCLDQAEIIESLSSQVKRLLSAIEQYTDIEDEEAKYKQLEKRRSRF
jgi:Fic family protein